MPREKCERCWQVLPEVGRNSDHPDICNRCAEAVSNLTAAAEEAYTLIRLGLVIAALVILLDQASKFWIVHYVMAPPRIIEITPFFNVVMVWNKGASFGLFSSQSMWTQAVLGGLAVAISLFSRSGWPKPKIKAGVSLGLVIGGALGNDRSRDLSRSRGFSGFSRCRLSLAFLQRGGYRNNDRCDPALA